MKTVSSNPKDDLQAIRDIMERSSKFLSLSGLAGVFAGICALAGAGFAWFGILRSGQVAFPGSGTETTDPAVVEAGRYLVTDALVVLLLAFFGAVFLSFRKAKGAGQPLWTATARRTLVHFLIPLATGGIFCFVLIERNLPRLVIPSTLIFYGLSLVNVGKFTFGELHYLGLIAICLGFLSVFLLPYGLLLWAIGFGVMHIVYGLVMHWRHER